LPHRNNIIVTKQAGYAAPGCIVTYSIDEALQQIKQSEQNAAFIIGGANIYAQFMPWTSRIYLTIIHHHFCGDAYFPPLDPAEWEETAREDHAADALNPYAHCFVIMERRQDKAR
jgi:dihydrofolate reductase